MINMNAKVFFYQHTNQINLNHLMINNEAFLGGLREGSLESSILAKQVMDQFGILQPRQEP